MLDQKTDKQAETDKEIFDECKARLELAIACEGSNRTEGLKALEFRYIDQWDNDTRNERDFEGRPALTVNHTDTLCRKTENQLKQARPRIKVQPVDGGADIETADVESGMIRHIENISNASIAYDRAATSALDIGWGYWRVVPEYCDPKSFNQELKIKSIRNSFTVYDDPSCLDPTGNDRKWIIITTKMKRAQAKREGMELIDFTGSQGPGDYVLDWENKEDIRLAEYYRIHEKVEWLYQMADGSTLFESELPSEEVQEALGMKFAMTPDNQKVKRQSCQYQVQWFKLNGTKVVDRRDLPGKWIPVVRCLGNEVDVNGQCIRFGMVKNMMEPAQMFNYWTPLALDTPIPTPKGWSRMSELAVGDHVFSESGKPCEIVGLSPVFIHRECLRVTFDDGSSIVADDGHLWRVEERGKRTKTGETWLATTIPTKELTPKKHFIDMALPIDLPDADLPINPYTLGSWLGDGFSYGGQICAGQCDLEETRSILESRGERLGPSYSTDKAAPLFTVRGLQKKLRENGLLINKHIPQKYLRASSAQRMELLRGLMDTDGACSTSGQCSFTSTSAAISAGFSELLRSLGIKSKVLVRASRKNVMHGRSIESAEHFQYSFTTHLPIFALSRKLGMIGRRKQERRRTARFAIRSIERVASAPVRCIAVANESHLFLAGESMVPTHNTMATERYALAPKAPWVAAEGQLEGHPEWDDANQKSYSVLKYKPTVGPDGSVIPPPQRTPPAPVEAGMAEAAAQAERNLLAVAGMPAENPGDARVLAGNKYLERRLAERDLTHFQYFDNQSLAIAQTGRIIIDLIPHYYDTKRIQRIIGEDGTSTTVTLNDAQESNGVRTVKNDLTVGEYDVVMDSGPSYQTKREESAETMVNLLGTPLGESVVKVGADLVVRNMDFAGAQELADRLATQTPEGIKKALEQLPKQAQTIVKTLMAQNQQQAQIIEKMQMELKYKAGIEQMKQEGETHRTIIKSGTDDKNSERDFAGWMHDIDVKSVTARDVAEINAASKLLNTRQEAEANEKAADKMIAAGLKDRSVN